MKKLIIALLCLLMLCGCGSKETEFDAEGCSKALDEAYKDMKVMDENELTVSFDLDTELFEEYFIKCASNETEGKFYAIVKVDDANKQEAKSAMNAFFNVLITRNSMYTPEVVKLYEDHVETQVGNYLIYLVAEDTDAYLDIVKEYIK